MTKAAQMPPVVELATDGSGQATTLQEALDRVADSGTIRVHPGVYAGEIVVRRPVRIVGVGGPEACVIEGRYRRSRSYAHVLTCESSVWIQSVGIRYVMEPADVRNEPYGDDGGVVAVMAWHEMVLTDCIVSSGWWAAVGSAGRVHVCASTLRRSTVGLIITGGSASVHDCTFQDGDAGIWGATSTSVGVDVTDCRFERLRVGIGSNFAIEGRLSGNEYVDVDTPLKNVTVASV